MSTLNSDREASEIEEDFSEEELVLWQAEQLYQQEQSFYRADFY
jgi:hypothetical protein